VSEWLAPDAPSDIPMRGLMDLLVTNILSCRPRLRDLSDRFDLPYSAIQRAGSVYLVLIEGVRRAVLHRLDIQLREARIVCVALTSEA